MDDFKGESPFSPLVSAPHQSLAAVGIITSSLRQARIKISSEGYGQSDPLSTYGQPETLNLKLTFLSVCAEYNQTHQGGKMPGKITAFNMQVNQTQH